MVKFIKKVAILIIQIWLVLVAIAAMQVIIEDLTSDRSNTTIIRGKYKEWKPKKWKTPSFPTKQE